jgi:hypothetical protein
VKKWFDSNYHFIVPEFESTTKFTLSSEPKPVLEYKEAKEAGFETRPVLLGPISYLLLGKAGKSADASFKPLSLLDDLVAVYAEVLKSLKEAGAESVQLDEPIIVYDQPAELAESFKKAYATLATAGPKVTIATYFGRITENLAMVKDLPVNSSSQSSRLSREPSSSYPSVSFPAETSGKPISKTPSPSVRRLSMLSVPTVLSLLHPHHSSTHQSLSPTRPSSPPKSKTGSPSQLRRFLKSPSLLKHSLASLMKLKIF